MKLEKILKIMEKEALKLNAPVFKKYEVVNKDPFKISIFAILSTRTKDSTTINVCKRLFEKVKNFEDLIKIDQKELENLLYGVGFYRKKAKILKEFAKEILEKFEGKIPKNLEELIKLPGIGSKVAKVILNELYDLPYVAVDIHVHRISNRIGIVNTKNIKETEKVLEKIIPDKLKIKYNRILVAYGQTICLPKNPLCKKCKIRRYCKFYINR